VGFARLELVLTRAPVVARTDAGAGHNNIGGKAANVAGANHGAPDSFAPARGPAPPTPYRSSRKGWGRRSEEHTGEKWREREG
jgi:hypothetical protein